MTDAKLTDLPEQRVKVGWRPIETLPYGENYLLFVPGTGVTVGHVSSGDFVIDVLNDCRETYATHWMPLPEPPAA